MVGRVSNLSEDSKLERLNQSPSHLTVKGTMSASMVYIDWGVQKSVCMHSVYSFCQTYIYLCFLCIYKNANSPHFFPYVWNMES